MKLNQLCLNLKYKCLQGSLETEVQDIIYNSGQLRKGVLFVCIPGAVRDGHDYISEAVAKEASAIVLEREEKAQQIPEGIAVLKVGSAREALALISAAFFEYPARKLITVGVTGTNGKTTTTHMIKEILEKDGNKAGIIGTLGAMVGERTLPLANTTPESYEIHRLFAEMVKAGCKYVVMEISSQGLKLKRTAGILFDYGIYTNLSPDHISPAEHASFAEYLACKSLLFQQCRYGIVNADDPFYKKILKNHTCLVRTFSAKPYASPGQRADLLAVNTTYINEDGRLGMRFRVQGCMDREVKLFIPGIFSVYNALAAILACRLAGISESAVLKGLEQVMVKGRMEILPGVKKYTVMIDYAHNRESTENMLLALKAYEPGRLICVYGCGGNRSRLRRCDMGEITGRLADLCVLTCDNPRTEEISAINEDIKEGLRKSKGNYKEIYDRREAIAYCLRNAEQGDIIVLLGKGHENYQEIKGIRYPFDEREIVGEILQTIASQRDAPRVNLSPPPRI